jgi:hypothetical protein
MHRKALVRCLTIAMAFVHTFPARRHLAAFVAAPSLTEGWKGFGALLAVVIYLLPVHVQARALFGAWRRRRGVLRLGGVVLAVAHAVPAWDHLPRFLQHPSWYDGWRGLLSATAVVWFLTPVPVQARALAALCRFARIVPRESRRLVPTRWAA